MSTFALLDDACRSAFITPPHPDLKPIGGVDPDPVADRA
jgi:hypothetical protein